MDSQVKHGYKQTEVGIIPEDWEVFCVSQAFEIHNNLRLPISESIRKLIKGDFPYYGPTGIQGFINEYKVDGEYALIGEDGDHFLKWRDQSMTLLVKGKFNVNNHAHLIKGIKNKTSWFYYYFSNRDLSQYLTRQGAGRYKLTKNALTQIPCAIPPIAEQEKIAEALSDIDSLIESLEELITKKHHIKQGAVQELLTGKKRLINNGQLTINNNYKQTELGLIPEDWEINSLKKLNFDISDGNYSSKYPKSSEFCDFGVPFIRANNINKMNIDDHDMRFITESLHNELLKGHLKKNDILVTTRGEIGQIAFVPDRHIDSNINAQLVRINVNFSSFDYRYIGYFLSFDIAQKQFLDLQTGSALKQLPVNRLKSLQIILPPTKAEQEVIAEVLTDMDNEITALEEKLHKTRQLKQGMMQELLTGKIRLI